MAEININKPHRLGKQAARQSVEGIIQKLAPKYKMQAHWSDDTVYFNGNDANGSIYVNATAVIVRIALSPIASLVKGTIQKEVQGYLTQAFGR